MCALLDSSVYIYTHVKEKRWLLNIWHTCYHGNRTYTWNFHQNGFPIACIALSGRISVHWFFTVHFLISHLYRTLLMKHSSWRTTLRAPHYIQATIRARSYSHRGHRRLLTQRHIESDQQKEAWTMLPLRSSNPRERSNGASPPPFLLLVGLFFFLLRGRQSKFIITLLNRPVVPPSRTHFSVPTF